MLGDPAGSVCSQLLASSREDLLWLPPPEGTASSSSTPSASSRATEGPACLLEGTENLPLRQKLHQSRSLPCPRALPARPCGSHWAKGNSGKEFQLLERCKARNCRLPEEKKVKKASTLRKYFLTPTRVFQTEREELKALIQTVLARSDNRLR